MYLAKHKIPVISNINNIIFTLTRHNFNVYSGSLNPNYPIICYLSCNVETSTISESKSDKHDSPKTNIKNVQLE